MSNNLGSLELVLAWVKGEPTISDQREAGNSTIFHAIQSLDSSELVELCQVLGDVSTEQLPNPARIRNVLQIIASNFVALATKPSSAFDDNDRSGFGSSQSKFTEELSQLYRKLVAVEPYGAAHILQCLSAQAVAGGSAEGADSERAKTAPHAATQLAMLLQDAPPESWQMVGLGLSPLWNAKQETLGDFFESLGDGYLQPSTMPVVLDLANFAVRAKKLSPHPYETRHETLSRVLYSLVVRLEKLEKDPSAFGDNVEEIQKVLADSVALAISLCDTLGLTGQSGSKEALALAMELSHRRIQTEAAAALARLGEEIGKERLIALAADPMARARTVHYADELGFVEEIDAAHRTDAALAESDLVNWLAGPDQFGVPPSNVSLLDRRTLNWPGYEEPRDCYLFRFVYHWAAGDFDNVGIVGPMTFAFAVPLGELSVDDSYAAFAGWQADHEEIFEVTQDHFSAEQAKEARRLARAFEDAGLQVESTVALAFAFGETSLVARLVRDNQRYAGATDGDTRVVLPAGRHQVDAAAEVALAILRGRELLAVFNDESSYTEN